MKHAILITAHKNFNILQLLIDTLDSENFDFFILIDKKVKMDNSQIIKKMPQHSKLYFIPRIQINWGGYSQIKAYMRLIEYSVANNYDYYHFIQGSDFPIKTKEQIDGFFEENKGKEFIGINPNETVKNRYCYYHFLVDNKHFRNSRKLRFLDTICWAAQKKLKICRNRDLVVYFGSATHSLTHNCVKFLLSNKKEIHRRFKLTYCADEIFVQTLLSTSSFKNNIYKLTDENVSNARLIDWSRRDGSSPHIFTSEDYDMLVSAEKGLCFARKFDENVDMDIVYKLYEYLNKNN